MAGRIVGEITQVLDEKTVSIFGADQPYQRLEISLVSGEKIIVENGNQPLANVNRYRLHDRVYLVSEAGSDNSPVYHITDYIRTDPLIFLLLVFTTLILLVARLKGLTSIVSMILTFVVLFKLILPALLSGVNPILVVSLASLAIIPISFYLSHGFNRKTTAAIIGSFITLILTTVLAAAFIDLSHLTGLSTEEAGMLALNHSGQLNMSSLLLSAIIVGTLGVLDDITVSQSAIADELSRLGKYRRSIELYRATMKIGTDHITSMVNTLVLAYAGVALPLLLIFVDNPQPLIEVVNNEMVAEEIVRTLVGSIGLIAAVPITTWISANWFHYQDKKTLLK